MIELKSLEEALEYKAPPQVQITSITDMMPTPGSDRLTSYTLAGGWTIFSSNVNQDPENGINGDPRYQIGSKVVYFAIDSVVPAPLEEFLCGNSKLKLDKGRIRIAKLRGAYSYGMVAEVDELAKFCPDILKIKEGEDLAPILGVVKYEPPVSSIPGAMKGRQAKRNKYFVEYNDIKNVRFYLDSGVFKEDEEVYVTAKLHGTSVRFGMLPTNIPPLDFSSFGGFFKTLKKKILNRLGLLPKFEYCLGTRRVQLQDKPDSHTGFYDTNVYKIISDKLSIQSKLQPGEILFGEIVGEGIQNNYDYGFKEKSPFGRYGFFAYDVMVNGQYLPAREFLAWCNERGVTPVPVLEFMTYDIDKIYELAGAKTCFNNQKIREGVVVKSVDEKSHPACGRRVFKVINPKYLEDASNTDFH